ncbi:MAG: thioredoxin family protein [Verrucomicrobiales bacterium]
MNPVSTPIQTFSAVLGIAAAAFLSPTTAVSADSAPKFHHDFAEASAAAKEAGKPLITIFSASWCPPCQQMKRAVYPSEAAQPYHEKFVWAYLDADEEKNRPLAGKFGVSGIPHIAFLRPDGSMIGHFAGAVSPEQFTGILDKVQADAKKPAGSGGSGAKQGSGKKR